MDLASENIESLWLEVKQEISLKKINGDQYEKTLRNGTCAFKAENTSHDWR